MAHAREALWAAGHDESVEVNQRALIDKVLARYSGEFTVFRELLQNSDDASAKAVEIHFETEAFLQNQNANVTDESDGAISESGTEKLPDLKAAVVHQWSFKNDGIIFRDEDWSRLKKIAEGNPDEEKIGAFGVGFYSLFSVTEEPFVTSGGKWMGFYWKDKKDQLFARRGNLPEDQHTQWTTFSMPLREPGPIPTPFDFIRFLASSITFMSRLSEVSVFFDGKRLARIGKTRGVPRSIGLRKGLKAETAKGTMRVTDISVTSLTIRAEIMQWVYSVGSSAKPRKRPIPPAQEARKAVSSGFFSALFSFGGSAQRSPSPMPVQHSEEDDKWKEAEENKKLHTIHSTSVVLAVFSADVAVTLDDRMRKELLRATKKNPPSKTKYELIYTGKDEYDASMKEDAASPLATGSVFQGLRADIEGAGSARVFIGHATAQTTGIGGHMSARFIPTVERESIDFEDRNVRVWNEELLGVGGYLARTAYEEEMYDIVANWDRTVGKSAFDSKLTDAQLESSKKLQARALHALKFFTHHTSTPKQQVSTLLEEAFFSCVSSSLLSYWSSGGSTHPFPIMSTIGIRGAADVRLPNPTFKAFLKQLPMLPPEIMEGAKLMVDALQSRDMIKDIKFDDVLKELRARPLAEDEMVACFKWWIDLYKVEGGNRLEPAQKQLLNAAVLLMGTPGGADEKIIPISTIETVLNSRNASVHIPTDGPLPSTLLPLSISRHFDPQSLCSSFGWREFTIVQWLEHILNQDLRAQDVEHDVTRSAAWAERVLSAISRAWTCLAKAHSQRIVELLRGLPCVPTTAGLKLPVEAYFQNAHVFPDLPLVKLPSGTAIKGPIEKVLEALGVRKHVELQLVFNRMIKTGDWSIYDLVKYLVAVQTTLSPEEFERLRLTAAFPKEQSKKADPDAKSKAERFRANQLYEPLDEFRELGLPVIDWGVKNKWRSSSEEAKFLFRLGLLRQPPLDTLINLAAGSNEHVRHLALKYLLDNRATKYTAYNPQSYAQVAFIPAIKNGQPVLANPAEVFVNKEWSTMGFLVGSQSLPADDLRKLGVKDSPPPSMLVDALVKNPPESEELAQRWFALLAGHITDFTPRHFQILSTSLIVPVKSPKDVSGKSTNRMLTPKQCYFRSPSSTPEAHSKFFTFIDFGNPANQFLSACGTKHEPTVEEIAQILLENPRNFYQVSQGRDNYLFELRNFAINRRQLSSGTLARMKRAPIFLGSRRVRRTRTKDSKGSADFEDEDDWEYQYDLLTPDKVVIADDTHAEHLFGDAVFVCPQEDLLEDFYREMGSRRLTSLIKQEQRTSSEVRNSRKAADVRSLILERLPLFLHEHTQTTQTKVPFSWLNQEKNFVVRTFGKLTVIKTLTYNETRVIKNQDASAVAFRDGRGPIELWLAGNDQVDMYEVSTSMCKLLFEQPKANDALLFMTILSTDLRALRRRGYNIDRILQKQKAQREAAEDAARRQAEQMALLTHDAPPPPPPPFPSEKSGAQPEPLSSNAAHTTELSSPQASRARPVSGVRDSLDSLKRRLTGKFGTSHDTPGLPGALPEIHETGPTGGAPETIPEQSGSLLTPPRPTPSRPSTPGVTPMRNISANIDMAIRACREERGSLLQSKREMKVVKESLNDSYCDITGQAVDMVLAGDMGGFKVFMARDIAQPKMLMQQKRESLARFIHVIQPLADIYRLPHSSLHIFFDTSGETIAFNRNASLFCNLRFFEAWHDEQVKAGLLSKAYISWYFTLAHEIAHNLVQPHNAEHEFWFSSLCEEYLPALGGLLATCDSA